MVPLPDLPELPEYQKVMTPQDFAAMEKAALAIAAAKIKDAADYVAAAGYFSVAGKVSSLPEPTPLMEFFMRNPKEELKQCIGGHVSRAFIRGFNPTPAQIRAAERMTKNLFKLNDGDMQRVAYSIHNQFVGTGGRVVPYPDVLQVLQKMSSLSNMKHVQPREFKPTDSIGQIRGHADDILRVAGLCSAAGGAYGTLRRFDTSITPPQLPPDWYFN